MASTVPNRSRRLPNLPNEWTSRPEIDDNYRNVSSNGSSQPAKDCCYRDDERQSRRYEETKASGYRNKGASRSDHELYKLSEERTSDEESLTEAEVIENAHGDVRPTYRGYDAVTRKYDKSTNDYSNRGCVKTGGSHQTAQYEKPDDDEPSDVEPPVATTIPSPACQRDLRDYANTVNLPQALIAMKKLERLKELQRQRDLSERYYSQEIKRLIGDHFFNKTPIVDPVSGRVRDRRLADVGNRVTGDATNTGEQRIRAGGFTKELEPCGTLTVITRLDCGCVRETTAPIFNNSIGHVIKCDGHRYQTSNVVKLTPTSPQELTYRTVQLPTRTGHLSSSPTRAKPRLPTDCPNYQNPPNVTSRDLEFWQDRRSYTNQPKTGRSPRLLSPMRNNSPVRKYSDTSSN